MIELQTPDLPSDQTCKRTCILVLGMHRSGTSAITRVLSMLGAALPRNVMGVGDGNELGHWEPAKLAILHDQILADLHSAWFDWTSLDFTQLPAKHRLQIAADINELIENEYRDAELFVIKEPRIGRFPSFFIDAVSKPDISFVAIIALRNPLDVIDSLMSRNGLWPSDYNRQDAALLWLTHMLESERAARTMQHAVVSYEALMDNPIAAIDRTLAAAGLKTPITCAEATGDIWAYINKDLRHHARRPEDVLLDPQVNGWVSDTYIALRDIELKRNLTGARTTLDRVRSEFLSAMPILKAFAIERRMALAAAHKVGSEAEQAALNVVEITQQRDAVLENTSVALADAEARVEVTKAQMQVELEALTSRLTLEAETAQAELSALVDAERARAGTANSNATSFEARFMQAQAEIADAEARVEVTKAQMPVELKALKSRLTLEAETAQAELSALIDVERARADTANNHANSYQARFVQAQAEVADAEARLEVTKAQMQVELDALNSRLTQEAATARAELSALIDAERSRADTANNHANSYEARFVQAQAEIADAEARLEATKAQMQVELEALTLRLTQEAEVAQAELSAVLSEIVSVKMETELTHKAYRNSSSWKMTSPFRFLKQALSNLAKTAKALPAIIRFGGGLPRATAKAMRVLSKEGIQGARHRVRIAIETDRNKKSPHYNSTQHTRIIDNNTLLGPNNKHLSEADNKRIPDISVIIPVYNNYKYTKKCVESVLKNYSDYLFEIIIMDDCSTDKTQENLVNRSDIRYFRNEKNVGFLRNCNIGASLAVGNYLLFLNNDTEVQQGWLTELRDTFDQHPNVGLVGSKLIYPNGQLQEAGGIIWEDGSAWNWGRLQDPNHPRYNFTRDCDYVSGASIMVRRDLFERLGRFDERYEIAYYEDTDFAMSVRAAGLRVLYQPKSIVTHYEGISSGNDTSFGSKKYQITNGKRFFDKWHNELKHNLPNSLTPWKASDRHIKGHILIIDECTPTPDQDSGSIDMFNLIKILIGLEYRVHFIPRSNLSHFGRYTDELQRMGVNCVYAPHYRTVDEYLSNNGDIFTHVFLARVKIANDTIDIVQNYCPSAHRIFYTVDLHYLREMREAELANNKLLKKRAHATKEMELAMMDRVHTVIVLSNAEQTILEALGKTNVVTIPLIREVKEGNILPFSKRNGVLFIGGYQHTPNADAADWLVRDIWPIVRKIRKYSGLPPIILHIYGSNMPERFNSYKCDDIFVHGFVSDLEQAFSQVRFSLAPLRYGAGLKGKLATSYGYGVPVIGTQIAYEGLSEAAFAKVVTQNNNPDGFAAAICDVYDDESNWNTLQLAGLNLVSQNYSIGNITPKLIDILTPPKR